MDQNESKNTTEIHPEDHKEEWKIELDSTIRKRHLDKDGSMESSRRKELMIHKNVRNILDHLDSCEPASEQHSDMAEAV